tara:strand:+ start:98 stop:928 length:831 start_codon:yes stop_codon:yes gene_type:complete
MTENKQLLNEVKEHWEEEVCGTRNIINKEVSSNSHEVVSSHRYTVEPHILKFLEFSANKEKDIALEIGVGAGSDFIEICKQCKTVYGIDLTDAAIKLTKERCELEGIKNYNLQRSNAEKLPFEDNYFNHVYSYGVIHHAPDTMSILSEMKRVTKPGGKIRVMVYSNFSLTGIMLYVLKGILRFNIFTTQEKIIYEHLESPGTKCYSTKEFSKILKSFGFKKIKIEKKLGSGDLLLFDPSKKYSNNFIFPILFKLYPRFLLKHLHFMGLLIMAEFEK